jgi:hypothetical protein
LITWSPFGATKWLPLFLWQRGESLCEVLKSNFGKKASKQIRQIVRFCCRPGLK